MNIAAMPWKMVRRFGQRMLTTWGTPAPIPLPLWQAALAGYPFLAALNAAEQEKLRALAALFLRRKRFYGAQGLSISDGMALEIAAQARLEGVRSLRESGLHKARLGLTSLEEVLGVTNE